MNFLKFLKCCRVPAVALVFSLGVTEPVLAQTASADPPAVPDNAGLVERFDNWEVRQAPGTKNYFLIGMPTDKAGQLWLMCEEKNFLTVAVSMGGKGTRQNTRQNTLKSQIVTLRVDDSAPRAFSFLIFESFVAMATELPGTTDSRVKAFLDALRDARTSLELTYDQTSHQFDVAQLPNARARFLTLCGRHPAQK
jgi:hypothetical protein